MNIYKIGTKVDISIDIDKLRGKITEILITGLNHSVQYKVIWFNGKTCCNEWFYSHEVEPVEFTDCNKTIGFK
jgi:hypothetical protein